MLNKGNILLVANWESNVGYAWWLMENFWLTISKNFIAKQKSCFLIYPKMTQVPESIASSEIIFSECNFRDHSFTNLIKLYTFIKSNSIQFIYLTDSPSYSFFYLLLRLWGVRRIVVHIHTPGERTKPTTWLKLIKTCIQRTPLYTADHFIAATKFVYQRFLDVSCIPPEKCSIASNGIKPLNLNNINLQYAYNKFSIPEDRIIIVTTGRASYYKGIDFFINCAYELTNNQGLDHLHFLFCGDGPDLSEFQQLAKQLNIEDNFTFAGKRLDVLDILPSCHIGFHAATGEVGYSLSILEYMSAGLVTIVPDGPSTSLATTHMKNGILYKTKDIASATNAINYTLNNDTSEISKRAIQSIIQTYNIESTNLKLTQILGSIFK